MRAIFIGVVAVLWAVSFAAFLVYDVRSQEHQAQEAMLEEARIFAREMDAVWEFIDNSQYVINTSSDGSYEFKGLYCAIVGKSVGAIFSAGNDYAIRYTNVSPRGYQAVPDEFEAAALEAFLENPGLTEYYGIAEYEGEERFRYVRTLEVKQSCLTCHGEPAGEIDITGHPKEGWTLDSLGGVISIVIPLDHYEDAVVTNAATDTAFFLLLAGAFGIGLFLALTLLVLKPLDRIKAAFGEMGEGELKVEVDDVRTAKEIADLIARFNEMAGELDAAYTNLEDKVAKRTADLREANAALEALNERLSEDAQFKSDLLSVVNHELRTPLTSIVTYAQISKEACLPEREADRSAWEEIEKNSLILLDMINNMLDAARFDAGMVHVSMEPIDLVDVAAAAIRTASPLAFKNGVSLRSTVGADVPLIMGDLEKIQRMIQNLVGNAVKFTPESGNVLLSVEKDERTGGVVVSVTDDGIGIAPEDQVRIFEKFVQVDGTSTRKYAGSGLGLALVREYAMAQGFTVSIESDLGRGSTFSVNIPKEAVI